MCSIEFSIPIQRRHSGESTSHATKDFDDPERFPNGQPGECCLVISEAFQPGRPRPYGARFPHQTAPQSYRRKHLHLLTSDIMPFLTTAGPQRPVCIRNSPHDGIRSKKIIGLGAHSRTGKLFWNLPSRTDCSCHHVCTPY